MDVVATIVTYRSDLPMLAAAVSSFKQCQLSHYLQIVDNDSGAEYERQLQALKADAVIPAGANRGFGFGHNIGIGHAPDSAYYLVMNPDVVVHDGCLEAMCAYLDAHPDIGLLAPKVLNPDGSLQALNKRLPSVFDLFLRRFMPAPLRRLPWVQRKAAHYEMRDIGYDSVVDVPFVSGCFMLWRRDCLCRVGLFDERFFMYLEDCDMTRRLAPFGRAVFYPDATITHHWMRGSHRSWRLMRVMLESMWHYYSKWGWKWV